MPNDLTHTSHERLLFLAYAGYEAGKRAQQACQQIAGAAGLSMPVRINAWKFELLELSGLHDLTFAEAADADLVVLALEDDSDLPAGVLAWIQLSLEPLAAKCKPLLVLSGSADEQPNRESPAEQQLRDTAAGAGISHWCLHPEPSSRCWAIPDYSIDDLRKVAQAVFGVSDCH